MAYTIQAFIGDLSDLEPNAPPEATIVSLEQGKALIPLTDNLRERYEIPFLPLTDGGVEVIPPLVESFAEYFKGPVAYIEAEFFGGEGIQASVVWKERSMILGPTVDVSAINTALRLMGITKGHHHDEFDALGLGKHRNTNSWARPSKIS